MFDLSVDGDRVPAGLQREHLLPFFFSVIVKPGPTVPPSFVTVGLAFEAEATTSIAREGGDQGEDAKSFHGASFG